MAGKRKPSEQRRYEGNPGKRSIPDSPTFNPLPAKPPKELGPDARSMWRRVHSALTGTGCLQVTDYGSLVALCETWQTFREATADLRARGTLVPSARGDGDLIRNPSVMVANTALERWNKLAASFGLTPTDRARLVLRRDDGKPNPLAEILEMTRRDR